MSWQHMHDQLLGSSSRARPLYSTESEREMPLQLTVHEQLINAIIDGSLERVKRLLRAGAQLNGRNIPQPFYRPLLVAARHCRAGVRLDILKLLIAKGADLEAMSPRDVFTDDGQLLFRERSRALHAAVHAGRLYRRADAVRVLLEAGADPNPKDSDDTTPLFYCSLGTNCLPCIRELLKAGADPLAQSSDGATPLHIAAFTGSAEMTSMLLASSPGSVNVLDRSGVPPLYYAATGSDPVAVSRKLQYLLAAGASESRAMSRQSLSSLRACVESGNEAAVRILVKHIEAVGGLDAVAPALGVAAVKGYTRLLRLLLLVEGDGGRTRWAQATVTAPLCETILHLAARHCSHAVVEILLQAGADPSATGSMGQRASDVIGLAPAAKGSQAKEREERAAAIARTLERGPAFSARSWAWPLETGAGLADWRPQAAVGVRAFRPRNRKFFVKLFARHSAKR